MLNYIWISYSYYTSFISFQFCVSDQVVAPGGGDEKVKASGTIYFQHKLDSSLVYAVKIDTSNWYYSLFIVSGNFYLPVSNSNIALLTPVTGYFNLCATVNYNSPGQLTYGAYQNILVSPYIINDNSNKTLLYSTALFLEKFTTPMNDLGAQVLRTTYLDNSLFKVQLAIYYKCRNSTGYFYFLLPQVTNSTQPFVVQLAVMDLQLHFLYSGSTTTARLNGAPAEFRARYLTSTGIVYQLVTGLTMKQSQVSLVSAKIGGRLQYLVYLSYIDPRCNYLAAGAFCLSCSSGFLFDNVCVDSCPLGYFAYYRQNMGALGTKSQYCAQCPLVQNGVCVSACLSNYYLSVYAYNCVVCSKANVYDDGSGSYCLEGLNATVTKNGNSSDPSPSAPTANNGTQPASTGLSPLMIGLIGGSAATVVLLALSIVVIYRCKNRQPELAVHVEVPVHAEALESREVIQVTQNVSSSMKVEFCCAICLDYQYQNVVRLSCDHYFHNGCIQSWGKKNKVCPLCRTSLAV